MNTENQEKQLLISELETERAKKEMWKSKYELEFESSKTHQNDKRMLLFPSLFLNKIL